MYLDQFFADADDQITGRIRCRNAHPLDMALDRRVVAEGVETHSELGALRGMGVRLFQGFLLARPALDALPDWSQC